jgi:hypothetical protein
MTDHHDFGFDQHDFDGHEPAPFEDHSPPDDHLAWEDGHEYDLSHDADAFPHEPSGHDVSSHDSSPGPSLDGDDAPPEITTGHADIPDLPEESPFPPAVDVGDLPEPVDGFPWIDTGSLGAADIHAALDTTALDTTDPDTTDPDTTDPVHPAELAEYNATDLPPGVDPWAALADSDDPATAALARWWQQN